MSELAGIITSVIGMLAALGAAGKFVWTRIESRFAKIEQELTACRIRERDSLERRGAQLVVIELMWAELNRVAPGSTVLDRAHKLLSNLKIEAVNARLSNAEEHDDE